MLVFFPQEVACLDKISLWMRSISSVFLLRYSHIRLNYILCFSFFSKGQFKAVTYIVYTCIINVKTPSASESGFSKAAELPPEQKHQ
jgi:hypothetical protein